MHYYSDTIAYYDKKQELSMAKDNTAFFKVKNSWSTIKDELLKCYLAPYFQKLLFTGKPIYYVDCFAGKGKFEDGNPGSPLIALQIRKDCLERTRKAGTVNGIQACFIDLNHAQELQQNIAAYQPPDDMPDVISGKYEDNIRNLLSNKRDYNVFLYIDPYGIKALDTQLFDSFQDYGFNSFEMLINFNSFGFFRDACRVKSVDCRNDEALTELSDIVEYEPTAVDTSQQSQDMLSRIADGNYWEAIVDDFRNHKIDGYKAEQRLSEEYKKRLKLRYHYVLDMPIRLKSGQRPKYRMIHVCDHEDGCFLMAQNMQKRKDELFLNIQQEGQLSLFDLVPEMATSVEGDFITKSEAEERLRNFLSNKPQLISITKLLAEFVNDNGLICDFKLIHDILAEWQNNGVVDIIRNPSQTKTGTVSKFWDEKGSQTVTIRRIKA